MTDNFINDDFLLDTPAARRLYHEYAANMPIFDYHCHLPAQEIANDRLFDNLTQIWLYGDHYKWRAMRTNGIDERYITGTANDLKKFEKWAQTVPYCLRNPLYHWTHMELKKPFGISDKLLNPDTAREIYDTCSQQLKTPEFSVRNLILRAKVKILCTTDDPIDSLEHHQKIKAEGFAVSVLPAWRPDKAMAAENIPALNVWIDKLQDAAQIDITDYDSYREALYKRHNFFHDNGCRLSDHGLDRVYVEDYSESQIKSIFHKIRNSTVLDAHEQAQFKSALLYEFALMDSQKGWTQQFHFGALRNNNSRALRTLGPDSGYDSIDDWNIAASLSKFLDRLESKNKLTQTILYNLNPRDNEVFATMIGNFQDGSVPGKLQYGPAWWFLDQKDGMEAQMNALSNMGLLSRFVGMVTDSRSFLSYSRHEYFRRILCSLLGKDVQMGLLPNDIPLLGRMVEDISFNNAVHYFNCTSPGE
ncbi:MAG: glucuronate isomerase [Sedimentisphaerales bacterium]|nr:glucuronate isomerase [Sedimentisphaerales bacterium]